MDSDRYPLRVTQGEDGVYRWRASYDAAMRRRIVGIILGSLAGVCLLLAVMALLSGADGEMLAVTLLTSLAVLGISGLICVIYFRLSAGSGQPYEMSAERLRFVGTGRGNAYYPYGSIRRVRIDEQRALIEVRGALSFAPFFVPREDFGFVQAYILQRLPGTADVEYR